MELGINMLTEASGVTETNGRRAEDKDERNRNESRNGNREFSGKGKRRNIT